MYLGLRFALYGGAKSLDYILSISFYKSNWFLGLNGKKGDETRIPVLKIILQYYSQIVKCDKLQGFTKSVTSNIYAVQHDTQSVLTF